MQNSTFASIFLFSNRTFSFKCIRQPNLRILQNQVKKNTHIRLNCDTVVACLADRNHWSEKWNKTEKNANLFRSSIVSHVGSLLFSQCFSPGALFQINNFAIKINTPLGETGKNCFAVVCMCFARFLPVTSTFLSLSAFIQFASSPTKNVCWLLAQFLLFFRFSRLLLVVRLHSKLKQ